MDKGEGGRNLDVPGSYFHVATVNTPAMALKLIEKGSQYALIDQEKGGEYFDGGKHYKLNIPANVPAKTSGQLWFTTPKHVQSVNQSTAAK